MCFLTRFLRTIHSFLTIDLVLRNYCCSVFNDRLSRSFLRRSRAPLPSGLAYSTTFVFVCQDFFASFFQFLISFFSQNALRTQKRWCFRIIAHSRFFVKTFLSLQFSANGIETEALPRSGSFAVEMLYKYEKRIAFSSCLW